MQLTGCDTLTGWRRVFEELPETVKFDSVKFSGIWRWLSEDEEGFGGHHNMNDPVHGRAHIMDSFTRTE